MNLLISLHIIQTLGSTLVLEYSNHYFGCGIAQNHSHTAIFLFLNPLKKQYSESLCMFLSRAAAVLYFPKPISLMSLKTCCAWPDVLLHVHWEAWLGVLQLEGLDSKGYFHTGKTTCFHLLTQYSIRKLRFVFMFFSPSRLQ